MIVIRTTPAALFLMTFHYACGFYVFSVVIVTNKVPVIRAIGSTSGRATMAFSESRPVGWADVHHLAIDLLQCVNSRDIIISIYPPCPSSSTPLGKPSLRHETALTPVCKARPVSSPTQPPPPPWSHLQPPPRSPPPSLTPAIVTGASGGIGGATAILFARAGCNLVLLARRQQALDDVAAQCVAAAKEMGHNPTITVRTLDVNDRSAVDALVPALKEAGVASFDV